MLPRCRRRAPCSPCCSPRCTCPASAAPRPARCQHGVTAQYSTVQYSTALQPLLRPPRARDRDGGVVAGGSRARHGGDHPLRLHRPGAVRGHGHPDRADRGGVLQCKYIRRHMVLMGVLTIYWPMVMVSEYIEELALPTQLHSTTSAGEAVRPQLVFVCNTCNTLAAGVWLFIPVKWTPDIHVSCTHEAAAAGKYYTSEYRRYRRAQKFVKSCQNILTFLPCQGTFLQRKYTDRNRSTLGWRKKFGSRHLILSETLLYVDF